MQTTSQPRKLIVSQVAIGFFASVILLFYAGDRISEVIRRIIVPQTNDLVSSSSPLALTPIPLAIPDSKDSPVLRFAVIGDYGTGEQLEADVAALVNSWNPDFIITTGDNNYPDGEAATIDQNIGQFFHEFIFPYNGGYGDGALENRFLPSLGNHDWRSDDTQPYLDYFTLPGNERYYEFVWGPVHFFVLDSNKNEPDGVDSESTQAIWL